MYNKFDLYMNYMWWVYMMICRFELVFFFYDFIYYIVINVILNNKCK